MKGNKSELLRVDYPLSFSAARIADHLSMVVNFDFGCMGVEIAIGDVRVRHLDITSASRCLFWIGKIRQRGMDIRVHGGTCPGECRRSRDLPVHESQQILKFQDRISAQTNEFPVEIWNSGGKHVLGSNWAYP